MPAERLFAREGVIDRAADELLHVRVDANGLGVSASRRSQEAVRRSLACRSSECGGKRRARSLSFACREESAQGSPLSRRRMKARVPPLLFVFLTVHALRRSDLGGAGSGQAES